MTHLTAWQREQAARIGNIYPLDSRRTEATRDADQAYEADAERSMAESFKEAAIRGDLTAPAFFAPMSGTQARKSCAPSWLQQLAGKTSRSARNCC
jgi:hypothetical protein